MYNCINILSGAALQQPVQHSQMKEGGPRLGERGLQAAEKYSTAFLKRSTLSSIRDWKAETNTV